MTELRLSVIIPAFNEENRIGNTLMSVQNYLKRQSYGSEILVVDDGSSDGTVQAVETHADFPRLRIIRNSINRGKGHSVRKGIQSAEGAYSLFTDADNSTPIEEIDKFWPYFDRGFEVVIGSRGLQQSRIEVHQAAYREAMGRVFNLLVRAIAVRKIMDTQCGFKAFTRRAGEIIFPRQTIERWGFDAELLFIASKHGLGVAEVPIRWFNSPDSRISSLRDSAGMFLELLSIRYKDILGLYR
ncbi:glycosyltransferase family 2 protein [bacterium]|nr:glycosyltransferase family 2 protein [candidate division CSSED10-310 bacterium]